ncbi:hypothetical protein [Sinorhizobium meliloti]|nr:hypothetical protein [Sinorhizobium meliloti]
MLSFDRIAADFAMTPICIGLLSVLLGTPFSRKALADGRMIGRRASAASARSHNATQSGRPLRPPSPPLRMILALPLALTLPMLGDGLLTPVTAIGSQSVITIAFSLVIVPLVAHATISDIPAAPDLDKQASA